MSDAEIDELLERFDATEPALQRRIIARLAEKSVAAEVLLGACREAIRKLDLASHDPTGCVYPVYVILRDAVAEATPMVERKTNPKEARRCASETN